LLSGDVSETGHRDMTIQHTLQVKPSAMILKIIYSAEKNLHMKYELLRHPDGIKVLPVTNLPQHIRYACSAGFLESGENPEKPNEYLKGIETDITHVQIR
jgi:hypothetical protein